MPEWFDSYQYLKSQADLSKSPALDRPLGFVNGVLSYQDERVPDIQERSAVGEEANDWKVRKMMSRKRNWTYLFNPNFEPSLSK